MFALSPHLVLDIIFRFVLLRHHLLLILNPGDLFMRLETQKSGIHFSTYWSKVTNSDAKIVVIYDES
jgi:hypothetical protein